MSQQSMNLLNKSRDLKERANKRVFEKEIDEVLKDKSLMSKDFEKKLAANYKTPANQAMINRYAKKNVNTSNFLDMSASAILPKLTNSLSVHHDKVLQMTQQKVESLIKDFNETAHRK